MGIELIAQDAQFGLRRFVEDDLCLLYEIESDTTLKQFVGGPVQAPRADWVEKARTMVTSSPVQFALVDRKTGALAGRVSLGHYGSPEQREVQIILAKEFVGCGFGRAVCELACNYAFGTMGAKSVWAVVDPRHNASINLMQCLGFNESEPKEGKRIFVRYSCA